MKYLRLYDLRNETVTVIPYSRTPLTVARTPRDLEAKKRKVGRRIIRWVKHAALAVAEFAVSLVSGLIFLQIISEWLREIRGYDAVGSEYFAAAFISVFVFCIVDYILEVVRERLWTRR